MDYLKTIRSNVFYEKTAKKYNKIFEITLITKEVVSVEENKEVTDIIKTFTFFIPDDKLQTVITALSNIKNQK